MSEIDMDWVREQMTLGQVKQSAGTSILRLFEVWNTMNHTEKSAKEAIEVFSKLALGQPIFFEEDDEDGYWMPAQPGAIVVTDKVRVKRDRYTGELGVTHNGRVCKVVGVRYGDIIVKSIDGKNPILDGTHYSPHDLEKFYLNE